MKKKNKRSAADITLSLFEFISLPSVNDCFSLKKFVFGFAPTLLIGQPITAIVFSQRQTLDLHLLGKTSFQKCLCESEVAKYLFLFS